MPAQRELARMRIWLWITAFVMGLTLVTLVIGTVQYAQQADKASQEFARQVDLNSRIRQMQSIKITLGDAETGQRGYLLTGKGQYLVPYYDAVAKIPALLVSLEGIPIAVAGFDDHMKVVKQLVRLKLEELSETIRLHDAGQHDAALALVNTDAGQSYMDRARVELDAAMDVIRKDRDAATAQLVAATAATRQSATWTVAALVGCSVLAGIQVVLLYKRQRRFAQDLAESESRHRAIVEDQQELVSLAQVDGTLAYVNPAYSRNFRVDAGAMIGKSLYDFVDPADRDAVKKRLDVVFMTGEPDRGENRMATPDGEERWFAWTNAIQRGPNGERMLHSVGREVTQRKQAEGALKASERFVRQITDSLPVRIAYVDRESRYRFVNAAHLRQLGKPREEVLGRKQSEIAAHAIDPDIVARVEAAFRGEPQRFEYEELFGSETRYIQSQLIPDTDPDGQVKGLYTTGIDITTLKTTERRLLEQTATLGAIVEAIPAIVAVFDERMRYRLVNRAFERWRRKDRGDVLGRDIAEVFGPQEYERIRPWATRVLAGETVSYEMDYPDAHEHRHMSVSSVPLRLEDGSVAGMIAVAQDITLHRNEEKRLLNLAERDPLTGVLNRAGFRGYLAARNEAGGGASIALLYIDLDHFKEVNDAQGHACGDELLRYFAERIKRLVRPTDAVARLGGDEFAVVLNDARAQSVADGVADKIVEAARMPFRIGRHTVTVGASVGVAFGLQEGEGWESLIARADAAVYRAKAAGRGQRA